MAQFNQIVSCHACMGQVVLSCIRCSRFGMTNSAESLNAVSKLTLVYFSEHILLHEFGFLK